MGAGDWRLHHLRQRRLPHRTRQPCLDRRRRDRLRWRGYPQRRSGRRHQRIRRRERRPAVSVACRPLRQLRGGHRQGQRRPARRSARAVPHQRELRLHHLSRPGGADADHRCQERCAARRPARRGRRRSAVGRTARRDERAGYGRPDLARRLPDPRRRINRQGAGHRCRRPRRHQQQLHRRRLDRFRRGHPDRDDLEPGSGPRLRRDDGAHVPRDEHRRLVRAGREHPPQPLRRPQLRVLLGGRHALRHHGHGGDSGLPEPGCVRVHQTLRPV